MIARIVGKRDAAKTDKPKRGKPPGVDWPKPETVTRIIERLVQEREAAETHDLAQRPAVDW